VALTQLPAVEPLRWGLRGAIGSAFVRSSFFNIYIFLIKTIIELHNFVLRFSANPKPCLNITAIASVHVPI
jgi:hypothetical protein